MNDSLRQQFAAHFPSVKTDGMFIARAPGRVNLVGEHTDYNDGFVCPMAIDRETVLLAVPRGDGVVRLHSVSAGERVEFPIDREVPKAGPAWALYPKGAAEAVRRRAKVMRGFDAVVYSTVPLGGGLSSSASFEVAMALAVLHANGATLPLEEVALACQWGEHTYPGMPCGIMDQFISAMGRKGHALLLDCRDRSTRHVPLDDPDLRVVISNSNVKHALAGGEYKKRREECEAAVAHCRRRHPQVNSLRDVTMALLREESATMDATIHRRARHIVTEIARTVDFATALERRDYATGGNLMYASHASMRDDFEISCAELDALVEIARSVPGVFGARMTGGGFGGCMVALCRAGAVEGLTRTIAAEYPRKAGGREATTFSTVASAGASVEVL